ncbi:rad51 DNA repair protein [Nitzschia inconspicua]|uniref:Rad51 DNA repair protein n=1 Tax=Nitzschia inconspicua TaxID=303405 RepID=A0A9K3Q2K2_9STRA|nr:rad51 DNA repair protein [Nitzschia inconspicua]
MMGRSNSIDANATDAKPSLLQRWNKLQQSAAEPMSALEYLERELERKFSTVRQLSTTIQPNDGEFGCVTQESPKNCLPTTPLNPSPPAPCLLHNPLLTLPLGCVTEIAGPAGAGKTQLALSMCADATWHSSAKAVYIALGGSGRHLQTVSRRLKGMLQARLFEEKQNRYAQQKASDCNYDMDDTDFLQDCLSRILIRWICNSDELFDMLHTSLPKLLELHNLNHTEIQQDDANNNSSSSNISVVILDGIADLFRIRDDAYPDKDTSKWHQHRAVALFQISNLCKELSVLFQVPFLIINGATSRLDLASGKMSLEPALGLAWSQCVNSSFFVDRLPESYTSTQPAIIDEYRRDSLLHQHSEGSNTIRPGTNNGSVKGCYRRFRCLKAPNIASVHHQDFYIDQRGIITV